jgi:hypothetical protein
LPRVLSDLRTSARPDPGGGSLPDMEPGGGAGLCAALGLRDAADAEPGRRLCARVCRRRRFPVELRDGRE